MNNDWQDNLRDRMEWHEEPAPEGLWEDIEGVSTDLKIRRLRQRLGAVAASAIILLLVGLYTLKENKLVLPNEVPAYSVEQVEIKQEKNLLAQETEVQETVQQVIYEKAKEIVITDAIVENEEKGTLNNSENEAKEIYKNGYKDGSDNSPENDTKDFSENVSENNEEKNSVNRYDRQTEPQLINYGRKRKISKLETEVYATNISSGANSKHGGFGSLSPYGFPTEEEEFVFAAIRSNTPEDMEPNSYKYVYTDIKHSQPIKLGVSLKYNLDNNWSITSGLSYTILTSELRSGNDEHFYESRQSLHYIGVPLNLNYTVWRNNKFSTYISGGGLLEKNISGTLATDYFIANKIETSDEEKISAKQLQWSVNSAIGFQYQLSENIGLYTEPGVAYHFKNKSDIETIYKEKPLNYDIRFGLRFSLNK